MIANLFSKGCCPCATYPSPPLPQRHTGIYIHSAEWAPSPQSVRHRQTPFCKWKNPRANLTSRLIPAGIKIDRKHQRSTYVSAPGTELSKPWCFYDWYGAGTRHRVHHENCLPIFASGGKKAIASFCENPPGVTGKARWRAPGAPAPVEEAAAAALGKLAAASAWRCARSFCIFPFASFSSSSSCEFPMC